ncbi:MAG: DNA methyltransferase [Desulfosalsimonadaceae bacterium]
MWEKFEKVKTNKQKLFQFHQSLRTLTFLDPACGCGNFLVIAYRELRLLELSILRILTTDGQQVLDVSGFIILNIDQFYGIEIEEFPAQIAQVALWLIDHQMNQRLSEEFGLYYSRIPLKTSANIVCGNALRMDWNEIVPAARLSYIMGNPPFVGKSLQNDEQKADMRLVFNGRGNPASLDFVSAWYVKAADMMSGNPALTAAFVSTNSIAQGEQVAALWPILLEKNIHINFAHRTFQWNNEASGIAAVHCVIIGFSMMDAAPKYLFEYENIKGDPQVIQAKNINPYLIDAPIVVLKSRRDLICPVSPMLYGSKPADGGNLLLSDEEYKELVHNEPAAALWIKRFLGSDEFLNNTSRYCLWLVDCPPNILNTMLLVKQRVGKVRAMRLDSPKAATRELARTPTLFAEIRQCKTAYLLVPIHTSENRIYIPVGYFSADVICGNANFQIPDATLYDFGIFTSLMHMAWMRTLCGRIKSDYRYANTIVYNNFPWPENPSGNQKQAIEAAAQTVLDVRAQFPDASLADLYDPLTMPPVLLKAHQKLDKAVDAAYGKKTFTTEAARVAFLFELYEKYINRLPSGKAKKG